MAFEGTLQEFTIRMHGHTLEHPYIEAQQGDTASRKVRIHLKTFDGADFLIPYGATAVLSVDKTDGHKVLNECEIEDSSTIIITLTSQALACQGKQLSQLYIFTDKGDIKTQKFYIHVPKAVYDQDAIKSTDEYGILQDLISRIESLGANVTTENITAALGYTPANEEDVARVKSDLNEISNVKAGVIIQTASGESIVANDSSDDPLRGLRLFGKTEQVTTTGAQLFDVSKMTTQSSSGLTSVFNADGSITVNGTPTTQYAIASTTTYLTGLEPGTYYISGGSTNGGCVVVQVNRSLSDGTTKHTSNGAFTVDGTETSIRLNIQTMSAGLESVNNYTIYPMLNKGSTPLPYEPYTGGIPSPNPQYPQDLVSVGDDGDVEVGVYGRNLFSGLSKDITLYATNERVAKGTYTRSCIIDVSDINSIYVSGDFSLLYPKENEGGYIYFGLCQEYPTEGISCKRIDLLNNGAVDVSGCKYLLVSARYKDDNELLKEAVDNSFMFSIGTKETPYEPYKGKTLPISTPSGLPGIKVTDATFATYTDENGQMWCADEKDYERGVHVQRVTKKHYTSVNAKSAHANHDSSMIILTLEYEASKCIFGICDKLKVVDSNTQWVRSESYVGIHPTDGRIFCSFSGCATATEAKAILDEIGGIDVQYILATPIETPLSEEEIAQYRALHTNYPVTTILNDSGAHMEMKYKADTKNYIDNKFAEMTNAILSMGGNV